MTVLIDAIDELGSGTQRLFDGRTRTLRLSPSLDPGQQAFQLATQIAILELDEAIRAIVDKAKLTSDEARGLARIGLANYFAGALILPYSVFLNEAERCRYDIELLSHRFGVGFETICHRLSTLQRHNAGACRSSSSVSTAPETYRSASRRPISIFRGSAAPVRCGTCMRPSPTRDVS